MEGTLKEHRQECDQQLQQEQLSLCPICNLHTGRRIRGKVYCVNCGYIES